MSYDTNIQELAANIKACLYIKYSTNEDMCR